MYQEEYKRWLAADLQDADLNPELSKIEGNDEEIKDRFAVALNAFQRTAQRSGQYQAALLPAVDFHTVSRNLQLHPTDRSRNIAPVHCDGRIAVTVGQRFDL